MTTPFIETCQGLTDELTWLLRKGAGYQDAPALGASVLDLVHGFTRKFLALPDEHAYTAHTLWMPHCWLIDCWTRTPRLLLVSPEPNCGKTTALEITQCFVPRAGDELVSNLTEAALYQSIEDTINEKGGRPTILHDQLDKLFGNAEYGKIRNAKVENIIESGFQRSGTIQRKMNGRATPFNVYAPMALAGAMDLSYVPDAIVSRSITIRLQRALPGEVQKRWKQRTYAPQAEPLCWLLRLWIELVHGYAHEHQPDIPAELSNRDTDKWEPLLTVADLAGGRWPELARVACVASVAGWEATAPSEGMQVLWAINAIFDELLVDRIHTETLMPELSARGFRWAARPIRESSLILARLLRPYGVAPRSVRIGPKSIRGFKREWFEDGWLRYPPPPDPEDDWDDPQAATPTTQPATPATLATDGDEA
ncbi:MAG: DUF3631 domain-containing protein [Mycobacterium sp.]